MVFCLNFFLNMDLNVATFEEMQGLSGIGDVRAQAIMEVGDICPGP